MNYPARERAQLQLSAVEKLYTKRSRNISRCFGLSRCLAVVVFAFLGYAPCFGVCDASLQAYMQVPRGFANGPSVLSNSLPQIRREKFEKALQSQTDTLKQVAKKAESFVFGALGGASGTLAMFPAEATKMRMQAAGANALGFFPTIAKTISSEGAKGLYRGLPSTLIGVAPEKAIMLGANKFLRGCTSKHQDAQGRLPIGLELLVGATSGLGQVLFSSPKEMIMLQMQLAGQKLQNGVKASPLGIIRKLGLSGLYKGASATALREVPFAALYFTAYSQIKGAVQGSKDSLTFAETLASATAAAIPVAFITTPADVIKTRMQAQAGQAGALTLRQTMRQIIKNEGVRSLFVGAGPRVVMKAPQLGIALLVVETLTALANPPASATAAA